MPSPTHDPTEALAAKEAMAAALNEPWPWRTQWPIADILLDRLSYAGWHLTRAGDELRAVQDVLRRVLPYAAKMPDDLRAEAAAAAYVEDIRAALDSDR